MPTVRVEEWLGAGNGTTVRRNRTARGSVVTNLRAGSLPIGQAVYAVPGSAVRFVSPSGANSGSGNTTGAPWLTIGYALANCSNGDTIVVRAGTYYESLNLSRTSVGVTLQNYPGEAVWVDGTSAFTSWTSLGNNVYRATGYTADFTRFVAYDGDDALRNFVDQVWVDDLPLTQIADGSSTPAAGQFSVDQTANTITLRLADSSNPSGHDVRANTRKTALVLGGGTTACTIRGIGFRRYSPDSMETGAAIANVVHIAGTADGTVLENVVIQESQHGGLGIIKNNCVVRQTTIQDCGFYGATLSNAADTELDRVHVRRINRHRWAPQPATAGVKAGRSRRLHIHDSIFEDVWQAAHIWLDVSCIDSYKIVNNKCDGSAATYKNDTIGVFIELSDGGTISGSQKYGVVAGNRINDCNSAVMALDAGFVKVFNNLANRCRYSFYLWQDNRFLHSASNSPGATTSEARWFTEKMWLCNNVVTNPMDIIASGSPIQALVYDAYGAAGRIAHEGSGTTPAAPALLRGVEMIERIGGNVFATASGTMIQLGTSTPDGRSSFNTPAALAAADSTVGGPWPGGVHSTNYQGSVPAHSNAVALPADVASALSLATGYQFIGAPLTLPTPQG